MKIELDPTFKHFVTEAVESGRYSSSNVVRDSGLDALATHEAKLVNLRAVLDDALAEGGAHDDADIGSALDDPVRHLAARAG